ncbi:flagellar biosynthesis protein FlhF [Bordetella hinzii]|uniref:Flagellar biosynthesis protein FlhF n=1 Tax=Bordetella hinzii OH87 BAL007II TaxID=1331262 RepID=A0ABR4R239_9BORD|nr:flagellar biosynthesis protein FlhF [Bordetella hinzii]KCB24414.1 flagellar biosynthesis protein FlhF [Bordetella hinzii OH87 BAL007II]QDJ43031.1 flagellar biosynthesis protein FlhF [Bordetella hinzii]QDJ56512.1 flagellar biosynthesis protein FlhF [Bordetella hinzii]QWF38477.1 flagellar biosynthesis protein FlhF [Bordetella hinzii]QWF43022.1 flagellar biosynthesis protein FlhF [Bordetella hinzii]
MKIHRFTGPNTRDVMRQVREVLGEDALIISNRTVEQGIEVLAALESEMQAAPAPAEPRPAPPPPEPPPVQPLPPVPPSVSARPDSYLATRSAAAYGAAMAPAVPPAAAPQAALPPGAETAPPASMARLPDAPMRGAAAALPPALPAGEAPSVHAAIDALRGALENRMDGLLWGGRKPAREPVNAGLFRVLLEAGFSMPLLRALLERLPPELDAARARDWARNELLTHLPVLRDENAFLAAGGVLALVGPTGVGKTTTLAKLAARCVAREGREQVAMLTTDNFRIGALEQLQIYGRLMGVPARSVRDAAELREALDELGSRKIILIDTTGISQRDRNVAEQAALLCSGGRQVRRLLVLNAASQGDTLDEVAHAYRHGVGEDVVGCIITKLDEATRLGPALDTAIRHRLPIHYISNGQKVPEHLVPAQAQPLVDHALANLQRPLYAPSEADLAALWQNGGKDPEQQRRLLATAMQPAGNEAALGEALDWLASDPACKQGRVLWRAISRAPAAEAARAQAVAMLRREFPAQCGRYLLAMHGKSALKGEGLPGGHLHATLMMSDRGAALAAPAQHLMLPHGNLNTMGLGPDQPAEALLARAAWLREALEALPQVQVFDMGTAGLSHALSEAGELWLARCAGGQRVLHDDCPTTLNAVARNLGYMPAGELPGGDTLWACGTELNLATRGHEGRPLRMIGARVVDARSGDIKAQYFGLSNLAAAQADAATVAGWLVHHERAKTAFRYMAHAWAALPRAHGVDALRAQALLAGQLAAACWQLSHAEQARASLAGLIGPAERKMPSRLLPVALLKMFALLEMSEGR